MDIIVSYNMQIIRYFRSNMNRQIFLCNIKKILRI